MKIARKFVAVVLPIILIGSLLSAFAVVACPIDDSTRPADGWSSVATPPAAGFYEGTGGGQEAYLTRTVRLRGTPAGRQGDSNDLHNVTGSVRAGTVFVHDVHRAWTNPCHNEYWVLVGLEAGGAPVGWIIARYIENFATIRAGL